MPRNRAQEKTLDICSNMLKIAFFDKTQSSRRFTDLVLT